MRTSGFINEDKFDKIEIISTSSSTALTYKLRIDGKNYFMKMLRPEHQSDKRYRDAFYKEFEAGKSIHSPFVVKYTSIENNEDGLYILMEYINGVTLEEKLTKEPEYFTKEQNTKKLLTQLAQALSALHKQGVVHLDIKPENILLAKNTNDVILVDLGYCLTHSNDHTAGCTRLFSAPETLTGNINEIDARSDIFSVGCLLQYIEEKTEKKLSHTLGNIKNRCLQTDKKSRFSSTEEIIDTMRCNNIKKTGVAASILLTALLAIYALTQSPVSGSIKDYIAWQRGEVPERFEADGIFYHITDHKARTVEVTFKGSHPDEFEYEYPNGEINIPQTITYKGRTFRVTAFAGQAFKSPYISKINIPESITHIADSAFFMCLLADSIYIPKSVEYIGSLAFAHSKDVKSFIVHPENRFYDSRGGCNAIMETATNTLLAGSDSTKIPQDCERIAPQALVYCNIPNTELPATLKEIGEAAFVHSNITVAQIPEGVTTLEEYTFQHCRNMQKVTLPRSLTTIKRAALSNCTYKEIIIPDAVSFIGDYAFDNCPLLETATIGSGVKSIGYAAFENCERLKTVYSRIPADSLFELNASIFNNIHKDCVLYVPRGAKNTYEKTFGWNLFRKIVETDL